MTLLEFNFRQQETVSKNCKNYCNTSIILKLCVQCIHCNGFCILFSSGAMCHIITIYKPVKQLHHILCYADIFFIFSDRTIHYCTFGREYNELYGICHHRHWRSRIQNSTSCYIFSFFVHAPRREHNGVVFILFYFYFVRDVQDIIYIFIQRELYHNVQIAGFKNRLFKLHQIVIVYRSTLVDEL